MHALFLVVATFVVLSGTRPGELIRVSLRAGRGGGAQQVAPAEPAAAPSLVPAEPSRQPAQQHVHRARIAAAARRARVETPQLASPPAGESATAATGGVSVGTDANPGSGGNGSGQGSGSAFGDGSDQRAACVYCPEPRYPFIARARGWQGSVDVGLLVLADGTVDSASLRRSSGYGVLDDAAIAVARQSRFSPPARHGLPAPLRGRIEYRFELTNVH